MAPKKKQAKPDSKQKSLLEFTKKRKAEEEPEESKPAKKSKVEKKSKKKDEDFVAASESEQDEPIENVESEEEVTPVPAKKNDEQEQEDDEEEEPVEKKDKKKKKKKDEKEKKAKPKKSKPASTAPLHHYEATHKKIPAQVPTWMVQIRGSPSYEVIPSANVVYGIQKEASDTDTHLCRVPAYEGMALNSAHSAYFLNCNAPLHRAVDWCYTAHDQVQYLATCTHAYHESHEIGTLCDSKVGFIQIWSFGKALQEKASTDKPKLVLQIEHEHGFAWDLAWMPNCELFETTGTTRRLGVLCAVFSDGTICVYTVPRPEDVHITNMPNNAVPIVRLDSKCEYINLEHTSTSDTNKIGIGEEDEKSDQEEDAEESDATNNLVYNNKGKKIPYCCSWSKDLRFLAIGCHDGSVCLYKVNPTNPSYLTLNNQVQAHYHPQFNAAVRSIVWSSANVNIFATASNDGLCKMFDIRDMFFEVFSNRFSRTWCTDVDFPYQSMCLVNVSHEGTLKQYDSKECNCVHALCADSCMWSVSCNSSNCFSMYCTSDGSIGVKGMYENSIMHFGKKVASTAAAILTSTQTAQVELDDKNKPFIIVCSLPYHFDKTILKEKTAILVSSTKPIVHTDTKAATNARKRVLQRQIFSKHVSWTRCKTHPSCNSALRCWAVVAGAPGLMVIKVPDSVYFCFCLSNCNNCCSSSSIAASLLWFCASSFCSKPFNGTQLP